MKQKAFGMEAWCWIWYWRVQKSSTLKGRLGYVRILNSHEQR